ncbi:hypothetical protein Pfo_015524 [Paulownia fortunei]|nr:hypothetical protein Pfo_015524 [Paulownia fortunei]
MRRARSKVIDFDDEISILTEGEVERFKMMSYFPRHWDHYIPRTGEDDLSILPPVWLCLYEDMFHSGLRHRTFLIEPGIEKRVSSNPYIGTREYDALLHDIRDLTSGSVATIQPTSFAPKSMMLLTHHGMVLKINHRSKRVNELILELEKETAHKFQTEITLDAKIADVDCLKKYAGNLNESLASLELRIEETHQQVGEANKRADEAEKANEAMEDVLLDHWLDGFAVCKQMFVTVDPLFDVSCLVPSFSKPISSGSIDNLGSIVPGVRQRELGMM